MDDLIRWSAYDQQRIRSRIHTVVEDRPVGASVTSDALEIEDAAVKASRRVNATLAEMAWIRAEIAEAIANREERATR